MPKKTTGKGFTRLMGPKKSPPRKFTPHTSDAALTAAVVGYNDTVRKAKKDRTDKTPKNRS